MTPALASATAPRPDIFSDMKSILQYNFLQAVSRALGWIFLVAMTPALARAEAAAKVPGVFFEERCFDCHDATEKKGGHASTH